MNRLVSAYLGQPRAIPWLTSLGAGILAAGIFLANWTSPKKGAVAAAVKRSRVWELPEYTQYGLWIGGWSVLVILALLFVTFPLWQRATTAETLPSTSYKPKGRWQWLGLVLVLILAAGQRAPLIPNGIQWDEHDNLRRNFHGFTAMDAKPGKEPWQPATWQAAFFENERGNNPFLYSVCAHASLDLWRAFTGAPRDRFNAAAMRVPSFIFGLLAIGAVWGLGNRLGGPRVALLAALVCALHPLHVRYSVEARGYCVTLWLAPLLVSYVWDFLRSSSWKTAFAVACVAAGNMYAFPGSVYFVATAVLLLAACLFRKRAALWKLVVAGSVALAAILFLMMPGVLAAKQNLDSQFFKNGLSPTWLMQTWHWMSVGCHSPNDVVYRALSSGEMSMASFLSGQPLVSFVALVLIPSLLMVGFLKWRQTSGPWGVVLGLMVMPPIFCLLHHGLLTKYTIFQWYMIYALPLLIVLAGSGVFYLGEKTAKLHARAPSLVVALAFGLFVAVLLQPGMGAMGKAKHWQEEPGTPEAHTIFTRGPNTWVTYQDGRVLRVGKNAKSE
jgi:hypothetical protein